MTILITAGPTVEDIDPVRFISNRSSGKLGFEVAATAKAANYRAILIYGPVAESLHARITGLGASVKSVPVRSAADMLRAVNAHLPQADAVIMTAAVADFAPVKFAEVKIKKATHGLVLRLNPTVDIARELGRRKGRRKRPVLIGFALETGTGRTSAQRRATQKSEALRKLREKNLDVIVLNSPKTMAADAGDFHVLFRDGTELDCSGMSKRRFARVLVALASSQCRNMTD
jgi:phosphopantothenoylcysteine decarboxylase/phosphopantothenate--cysteine ligase